jgi:hypothetical protein
VLDRATRIARVVPYREPAETIRVRHARKKRRRLRDAPLPAPLEVDIDMVELLLEERQGER